MRITRIETAAIAITLVLISLMAGFFLGRNTTKTTVINAEPEPSEAVLTSAAPEQEASAGTEFSYQETSLEETGLLDLNLATAQELEALPGIGSVLAQRILDYREEIGSFTAVEELKNVEGIGDKKFEAIRNLIEVGNNDENSGG